MVNTVKYTLRDKWVCKAFIEKVETDPPSWWIRLATGRDGRVLKVRDEEVALATLRLFGTEHDYIVRGTNGEKV